MIQFRWLLIVLGVLIVGISGLQTLKKLSIDNSLGIWFLEEDPTFLILSNNLLKKEIIIEGSFSKN